MAMGIVAIFLSGVHLTNSHVLQNVRWSLESIAATRALSGRAEQLRALTWTQMTDASYLQANALGVASDGSGLPASLYRDRRGGITRGTWSPGGEWLVFEMYNQDIHAIRPGVDSVPSPLAAAAEVGETMPDISPDGKWLLYNSRRTGRREVYVVPFPNVAAGLRRVSTDDGRDPRWSRDGREIFYRNANDEMVARAVESSDPLTLGARRVLFKLADVIAWDVAPDGRFLVVRESGAGAAEATTQLVVVEGFFQDLRSRTRR